MDRASANLLTSLRAREVSPDDHAFLLELYGSTREDELAMTSWAEEQKSAFVQMQFQAQLSHYQTHFPNAAHQLITRGDEPVGRLYVARNDNEIRLLDITIAPNHRNRGIGRTLMQGLIGEAYQTNRSIKLFVWALNQGALRFYERLGFKRRAGEEPYIEMEMKPEHS